MNQIVADDVSKILWEVWDPLGLRNWAHVPHEYDDCIPVLIELVNTGASDPEIACALNRIFIATIGGDVLSTPIRNSARAARALVSLRSR